MSNPGLPFLTLSAIVLTAACSAPAPAGTADEALSIDAIAAALAKRSERQWVGFRTKPLALSDRPQSIGRHRSPFGSVSVHRENELVSPQNVQAALRGLEAAERALIDLDWGGPAPDGTRGGDPGFDLYLSHGASVPAAMHSDGRLLFRFRDALSAFARLDPALPSPQLQACAARSYVEATLLAVDPAESPRWRSATSEWLVQQIVGLSCEDNGQGLAEDMALTPIRKEFLAFVGDHLVPLAVPDKSVPLETRAVPPSPADDPIRTLWTLASQRTWNGELFRASPNLMETIALWTERNADELDAIVSSFAVRSWISLSQRDERQPSPSGISHVTWRELPYHGAPTQPPLEMYGSTALKIDLGPADTEAVLHVWLHGEFGTRWDLTVVRLDADLKELSRMQAAARERIPRSFLPVHLDRDTRHLLVVATNLGIGLPDIDLRTGSAHSCRLTVAEKTSAGTGAIETEGVGQVWP